MAFYSIRSSFFLLYRNKQSFWKLKGGSKINILIIIINPVTMVVTNIGAPRMTFGLFHLSALLWILKSALNR